MRNAVTLTKHKAAVKAGFAEYWVLRWFGADGSCKSQSIGRTDTLGKRDAEKIRIRKEVEFCKTPGRRNTDRNNTLAEYLDLYKETRKQELAPSTLLLHELVIRWLKEHFGENRRIDTIKRLDTKGFKAALIGNKLTKRDKRKSGPVTVEGYMRISRTIFAHALDDEVVEYNPFDRMSRTPDVKRDWHYVGADEFNKMMDHATHNYRVLLALCRMAGLRRAEALNLAWIDIDFDKGRLRVIAKRDWKPKDRSPRTIPVCQELMAVLTDAQAQAAEGQTKVVLGIDNTKYGEVLYKLFRKSGVVRYRKPLHSLRKSCITDWAKRYPAHVVMEWAGHSDFKTTNDYYLQISESEYDTAAGRKMFEPETKVAQNVA